MKKIILSLILISGISLSICAQDLNKVMADLTKVKNAVHQVVDQETLKKSTGDHKDKMPSFMDKVTKVEVIALENGDIDIKDNLIKELSGVKNGNGYETLLRLKDEGDNVFIISHKENESFSHVYIVAIDDEDIAFVKLSGDLNADDMMKIVEEQKKNKNK